MIPQQILARNIELLKVIGAFGLLTQKMGSQGTPVSKEVLYFKAEAWKQKMLELRESIFTEIGERFNFDSPKQVTTILAKLGYEPIIPPKEKKPTTGQYAFATLLYRHNHPLLKNWMTLRRLRHRDSNFVSKFLIFEPCPKCTEKTRGNCEICAATGRGKSIGFNPRYITEREGYWYLHPMILLLAITGRPVSLDPNINQFPRNNLSYDIWCRDIVVAPPGYTLVMCDLAKAERRVGAILYNDPLMLEEVNRGSRAFTALAMECFGLTEDQCKKGTDWYTTMKTTAYADQYFVQALTLHEYLMKQDIYVPIETCQKTIEFLAKKYHAYKHNVMQETWDVLNACDTPYISTLQGRLMRLNFPIELHGYKDWQPLLYTRNAAARIAFFEMCRKVASFRIQGTATGDNCLLTGLRVCDEVDKLTKPNFFSPVRMLNGDWNIAYPFMFKYDEWAFVVRDDYVERVSKILVDCAKMFGKFEPYLKTEHKYDFGMDAELSTESQWSCELPENWREMTREKNPNLYYENGVMFKV